MNELRIIDASKAREITKKAQVQANLERALGIIADEIVKNANDSLVGIFFTPDELHIEGDKTHIECSLDIIANVLKSRGYNVHYDYHGIRANW